MKKIRHRQYFIGCYDYADKLVSEEMFFKCLKNITKEEYVILEKGRTVYRGNVCFSIVDKYEWVETKEDRRMILKMIEPNGGFKMKSIEELKMIEMEDYILSLAKVIEEHRKAEAEIVELNEKSKKTDNIMEEPVEFLELSTRMRNILHNNHVDTIKDLCSKTPVEAYRLRGMGDRLFERLVKIMEIYGLCFAEEDYE